MTEPVSIDALDPIVLVPFVIAAWIVWGVVVIRDALRSGSMRDHDDIDRDAHEQPTRARAAVDPAGRGGRGIRGHRVATRGGGQGAPSGRLRRAALLRLARRLPARVVADPERRAS